MCRDHGEKPIDILCNDPAVRDGNERRRVEDDVVVALPRVVEQRLEPRGFEQLVRRDGRLTRGQHREVEVGELLDRVPEREPRIQERVYEGALRAGEPEPTRHRGSPKVDVHQQDASARRLRERPREVDGGRGLAVADPRARDRYDLELGALAQRLHDVAENAVLLGLEGRGIEEAHEERLDTIGAVEHELARRRRCREDRRLDARRRGRAVRGARRGRLRPEGLLVLGSLKRFEELAHRMTRSRTWRASARRCVPASPAAETAPTNERCQAARTGDVNRRARLPAGPSSASMAWSTTSTSIRRRWSA